MEKIKLRALTESDLDKTLQWHNQDDIVEMYSGHPFPVNREMEKQWYSKILTSNFPVTVFGIEEIQSKTLIGISVLREINMINRSAEFAIYIGEKEFRGKGLSEAATIKTLEFAFSKLGLNRVFLKVLASNTIAIKLYEKIGFAKEGVLRESSFKNGLFWDELLMSLLFSDYNAKV